MVLFQTRHKKMQLIINNLHQLMLLDLQYFPVDCLVETESLLFLMI